MNRVRPEPLRERWQPLRAGLIDLFYYDSEEFWFRDGRLLLRGNNGTGKSKVLALTLPFLLDGDLSAHRVEPDADPKKRMEWNLLLGGAHPNPERLGYAWLEFGRVDERGEPVFLTLGCGIKAVSGRGIAQHWFFITDRRLGEDLELVDATGTALSRDRLGDALGARGTVYPRARDYRRAVDESLFALGEQRYGALVDLLVQLRQPQLSKRPSEKALSGALTEALPPLDQAMVADVADAFRSLEDDRESLQAMREGRDAARSFLDRYRHYARIASRRKAELPREAQQAYERTNRELAEARTELDRAHTALVEAREKAAELEQDRVRLEARDQELRKSPEMHDARELEHAAKEAERLAAEAQQRTRDQNATSRLLAEQQERDAAARARVTGKADGLSEARSSTMDCAGRALVEREHVTRVDTPLDGQPELARVRREAEELVDRQRRAVSQVSGLLRALASAAQRVADARRRLADLDTQAGELGDRRAEAQQAAAERGAELVAAVRGYFERTTELRLADPAGVIAELELWVETLDGQNPVDAAARAAGQLASDELARTGADLEARERAARERAAELDDEIARLERGEDDAPPVPHTRDEAARADRPGAPLWQLVDFAPEVSADRRAAIEAALEAAGVLDAWVAPNGELLAEGTGDVLVRPGDSTPESLRTVLRPAVDRDDPRAALVSDEAVAALLSSIGWGEHGHSWVAPDGRFRVGVLEGAWQKPVATYIGRGAREAARRARLAELREQRDAVAAELDEVRAAQGMLGERKRTVERELAEVPRDEAVRRAHAHVASLADEHRRLMDRHAHAVEEANRATAAEDVARAELDEGARDAGLPADEAALAEVGEAVTEYRASLGTLWPAVEALAEARRSAAEAAGDLERARENAEEAAARAATAATDADEAAERHRTLAQTVGAAVEELQRRLAEVAQLLSANKDERTAASAAANEALRTHSKIEGRLETLEETAQQLTTQRAAAADAFRRFASTGLLLVALPELEVPDPESAWSPDPAVRLARRVDDSLSDVDYDDAVWDRAQRRLNDELTSLQETLSRYGNRASADLREDGVVVEVEFSGRVVTVPDLAEALVAEVAERERLLGEREREILENHLINEIASTLQELIGEAEYRVRQMNDELRNRPTSTGMSLRLVWQPREDGPTGLAAARERLLRQTSDAWSEDDRAAVGEFLQARIGEVRARDTAGTWLEHLTEALDYRSWHRFVIQINQNGQWRSAAGPASGGERVLAASVPLFAAAASHYRSAGNPHAPRLVTLDEAFAGVDDNARAKYLGLLAAFDLDVVMTSEREWGCYPEVPGLAISQLSRMDGVPAVLVTNWEWDGASRTRVDHDTRLVPG